MRGKDNARCNTDIVHRITPAYAGKRGRQRVSAPHVWDHPRLCGEKCTFDCECHFFRGSPPPMRGKEQKGVFRMKRAGITPAYAGKRQRFNAATSGTEDHPRLCGEKHQGLYPRSRSHGITPAYAGKRQ